MSQNQPVNLHERRQERAVTQVRQILKTGVLVGGKWIWTEYELQANPTTQAQTPSPPPARQAPPMTMGRDPAAFLITIGKKFQGKKIGEVAIEENGMNELYDFAIWGRKQKDPSPSLEVLCEMIEAFLIEREFVPQEKYKTPRRTNANEWGGGRP